MTTIATATTLSPASLTRLQHQYVIRQLGGLRFAADDEPATLVPVEFGGCRYVVRATDEVCSCTSASLACVLCGAEE